MADSRGEKLWSTQANFEAHLLQSLLADDKAILGQHHEASAAIERQAGDGAAELSLTADKVSMGCRPNSSRAAAAQLQVGNVLQAGDVGLGRWEYLHEEDLSIAACLA